MNVALDVNKHRESSESYHSGVHDIAGSFQDDGTPRRQKQT